MWGETAYSGLFGRGDQSWAAPGACAVAVRRGVLLLLLYLVMWVRRPPR